MTKDVLSVRLALSKRTDFQKKKNSKFYFSPFLNNLKPLYLSFKSKLIYPNIMIMKQVPHYTMHKKNKIVEIRTELPPRKSFFNVISLMHSLMPSRWHESHIEHIFLAVLAFS